MAPTAASASSSSLKGQWRPTKIMNMRDLSRDDDFMSHLLVEKLGTGDVPLVVHKMDPGRRLPKTNAEELLQIVRRVSAPNNTQRAIADSLPLPSTCHCPLCRWSALRALSRTVSGSLSTPCCRESHDFGLFSHTTLTQGRNQGSML